VWGILEKEQISSALSGLGRYLLKTSAACHRRAAIESWAPTSCFDLARPMLVLNQGCLGAAPQIVFSTALVKKRLKASKSFAFTTKEKPRESGASSRFGVGQDSFGSGEIGEPSSPPLTLAVFRLAE